jgi:hypothetical protein
MCPPPTPADPPSPKRLIFGQLIAELRDQSSPPTSLGNPGLPPSDVRKTPAPSEQQLPAFMPTVAESTEKPIQP